MAKWVIGRHKLVGAAYQNENGGLGTPGYLLSVLPGGPSSTQIGTGSLTDTNGRAVTCARDTRKYCTLADGTLVYLQTNQIAVEPNGILVEGASTNLLTYSQDITNAAWSTNQATPVGDVVIAPDGTLTADTLTGSGSGSLVSAAVVSNGGPYIASWYAKVPSGTLNLTMDLHDSSSGGTDGTASITLTTSWQRFAVSAASTTNGHNMVLRLYGFGNADVMHLWGAQLEAATGATSYIPTTSAAAQRDADTITYPAVNLSSLQGSVQMTVMPIWASTPPNIPYYAYNTGSSTFLYSNANGANILSNDSSNVTSTSAHYSQGVARTYKTSWTAVAQAVADLTDGNSASTSSAWTESFTTATLSSQGPDGSGFWLSSILVKPR